MDSKTAKAIGDRIVQAVRAELGEDYAVQPKGGTRRDHGCTFKVEVAARNKDGTALTKEREDLIWACNHGLEGLKAEHVDAEFVSGRETFTIVGYRARAQKRPLIVRRKRDGKECIFTIPGALAALCKKVEA